MEFKKKEKEKHGLGEAAPRAKLGYSLWREKLKGYKKSYV